MVSRKPARYTKLQEINEKQRGDLPRNKEAELGCFLVDFWSHNRKEEGWTRLEQFLHKQTADVEASLGGVRLLDAHKNWWWLLLSSSAAMKEKRKKMESSMMCVAVQNHEREQEQKEAALGLWLEGISRMKNGAGSGFFLFLQQMGQPHARIKSRFNFLFGPKLL